jgi:hypothetical protein
MLVWPKGLHNTARLLIFLSPASSSVLSHPFLYLENKSIAGGGRGRSGICDVLKIYEVQDLKNKNQAYERHFPTRLIVLLRIEPGYIVFPSHKNNV